MNKLVPIFSLLLFCVSFISAQPKPYRIEGTLANYTEDTIFLGYYYGDKQYLMDTTTVEGGHFVFEGMDTLHAGVYLIVMPPDNKYFQLMINAKEQRFSFSADLNDIEGSIAFEDAKDNALFYDNLRYISAKRKEVGELNARKEASTDEAEKVEIDGVLSNMNDEVMKYQHEVVDKNPETMTAALIKSGYNIPIPEFTGTKQEISTQQYLYYKKHYFDHVDLSDERLLRSPSHVMDDRVKYYLEKLTPQIPDSVNQSIDYLLGEMEASPEVYKNYLIKFLNDFAATKIVGMDAVYVHLALNYYAKGKTPWVEEEQLQKIIDNARSAEPTLVGKNAPKLTLQLRDSTDISLYDIDAKYLILVFWAHDCGHCKESMPQLKKFYDENKDKGIEVFSVCTKLNADEPPCWDFIDERNLEGWINASDKKGGRSFMHSLYNVKKTPKLFILDENKQIISKDLGTDQLDEFFDQLSKTKAARG